MEQTFVFQSTPPDVDALFREVSLALQQLQEMFSRQKYPRIWTSTDWLNRRAKVPAAVRGRRHRNRRITGMINWMLAILALPVVLLTPDADIVFTVVGWLCLGVGVISLWRCLRMPLGFLSLLAGGFFMIATLGEPAKMEPLLPLAVTHLAIGLAALVFRKRTHEDPFDRAARKLLQRENTVKTPALLRFSFSEEKISLGWEESSEGEIVWRVAYSYHEFERVMETESVLLIIRCKKVLILQKKDLLDGTIPELRAFLQKRIPYTQVSADMAKKNAY